jgi:hypothetical protein
MCSVSLSCLLRFGFINLNTISIHCHNCGRSRGSLDYFRHQRCKLSTFLSIISIFSYKSLII